MSYPSVIQPLVIEDEVPTKEGYDAVFATLKDTYDLAPACYAFSHDQAAMYLDDARIFHVVVLDLRIPRTIDLPPQEGIDLGRDLLTRFAKRDAYPIPALLVISAHIGRGDQQQLRDALESGFFYGKLVVKGPFDMMRAEIERAVIAARQYCGIGLHVRDAFDRTYPTISPREEDLLRRVVHKEFGAVGVDLEWWSAVGYRSLFSTRRNWTKVLMGRALFGAGDKPSRANFFKFIPAGNAAGVVFNATRLQHKLSHIKVNGVIVSESAALIVTEKIGSSNERPVAFSTLLSDEGTTRVDIEKVARQITEQIVALGESGPQSNPIKKLLWRFHDFQRVEDAMNRYGDREVTRTHGAEALRLLRRLSESPDVILYTQQSFLHGDLHIGNIALEKGPDGVSAFVFDAGGTESHVSVRDIAALEVSLLLHQDDVDGSLVDICESLYTVDVGADEAIANASFVARNTYKLIRELRARVAERAKPQLYALMVFDAAVIQLGGLQDEFSSNKVTSPPSAAALVALTGLWYERLEKNGGTEGIPRQD